MSISRVAFTPRISYGGSLAYGNPSGAGFQGLIEKELEKLTVETQADKGSAHTKLTSEDISELAAKYNPTRMTAAEYDSFLEDLVDKGVLTNEAIIRIGYRGMVYVAPGEGGGVMDVPQTSFFLPCGFDLRETNGNPLLLARMLSLSKPVPESSEAFRNAANMKRAAYATIANVLDAIRTAQGCGTRV